jgi:nitrous oxidase accessory protein
LRGEGKRGGIMKTERRVKLGKVLIFVVLFAAFLSVGCASAATTYTVCPSGCDYASIQAAIEVADPSDTIEVQSGTYYENVDVNKTLILKGVDTGDGKPVVDAGGRGSAITLSANGITLDGFTVTNSGNLYGDEESR